MINTKPMLVTAAVLIAGLVPTGAGVLACSPPRVENTTLAAAPPQEARPPAAAPPIGQDPPRPAVTKPAADQGPLIIQAEVVDPEGRHLSGVNVLVAVSYSRGSGALEMVLARSKSNAKGQARLEVARERPDAKVNNAYVWAYQPGRAIATTNVSLAAKASPLVIPLTLSQPAKWTITVLGPDDRPIAGLHLAPHLLRITGGPWTIDSAVPDALLEPLTVTTDAKGVATPTYLSQSTVPLTIHVAGPGVAPHTLPLDAAIGNGVLKLGRSGRVVGIVRTASGQPMADVPVEVWVQGSSTSSASSRTNRPIMPDAILRLNPQPLKTGPHGAFQTPPILLSGLTYRVSIRQDGFSPFVSDWVPLDGERVTIPPIRLRPLRKVTGQIKDRQARAVAGARVFLPGRRSRYWATDAQGRFALVGVNLGKTVILAEHAGFRLQGWLVDPSARVEVGSLTLVRASEAPESLIEPLADPIPPEEARALADRLLEPYLNDAPEKSDDHARLTAIVSLSRFDLDRALDLFQKGHFLAADFYCQNVRGSLAARLAAKDPARAEAMVEEIPGSWGRIHGLVGVAKALPASEHDRKNALLERAANLLKDFPPVQQLYSPLPAIAEQWLNMGARDRARLVLEKGNSLYDARPPANVGILVDFLMQLARLEPDQAMERVRKLQNPSTITGRPLLHDPVAAVAVGLATDHPAEAERAFHLWQRTGIHWRTNDYVMRLCHRLARVDPPRARRVAAAQQGPAERALAWAYVALGLAVKDKAGALEAVNHAIQEIDRLRESGPGPEVVYTVSGVRLMYPANPAAAILPVVERAAPDRLAEVFWRAVALHPRLETDREDQLQTSYIGFECILLSHYDRAVAAALFEPMDSYLKAVATRKGPHTEFASSHIVAKACIDPRAAVAFLESLTPPREFSRGTPAIKARLTLAEALGLPPEKRWMHLWHSIGIQVPLDD